MEAETKSIGGAYSESMRKALVDGAAAGMRHRLVIPRESMRGHAGMRLGAGPGMVQRTHGVVSLRERRPTGRFNPGYVDIASRQTGAVRAARTPCDRTRHRAARFATLARPSSRLAHARTGLPR